MLLVEQEKAILLFQNLYLIFCIKIISKKKRIFKLLFKSKSNNISNAALISLLPLSIFPFAPHACTHPTHCQTPLKTLHTTEVYLRHVIFVLVKLPSRAHEIISRAHEIISRAHEIISRAHEMIYRELSFQRQIHVF